MTRVLAVVDSERSAGRSVLEVLTGALRSLAEHTRDSGAQAAAPASSTALCEVRLWGRRLRDARVLSGEGADFFSVHCPSLFHSRTGLARCGVGCSSSDEAWGVLRRRCRRQVRRAAKKLRTRQFKPERTFVERCDEIESMGDDPGLRFKAVCRLLSPARANPAMRKFHPGDDAAADPIGMEEEGFLDAGAEIGAANVRKLDGGAIPSAFRAWCEVFSIKFDGIRGSDGGEWALLKEFTFPLFCKVKNNMPSGKAVGEGGFSIELLRLADEKVCELFYDLMMEDLKSGHVPLNWHSVLYALLVKPFPNNAALVSERREIALMAVDMKCCLHMLRACAYAAIQPRLVPDQLGWAAGYGTGDIGLVIQVVIQQARRLRMPLYLLYLDLATFFPRIDREIGTAGELLHGLPADAAWLVALIYGGFDGKEPVKCKLDTAAGLSAPFSNWMGWLMGCVLSPDKAKIFLNVCLIVMKLQMRGVPLFGFGGGARFDAKAIGSGPSLVEATAAWRVIQQMVFGDDWAGVAMTAEQLHGPWYRWSIWAELVNAKIGVKLLAKTVVTGVEFDDSGKACTPPDPCLRLVSGYKSANGNTLLMVPFMAPSAMYKHVGIMRRADGSEKDAWLHLFGKLTGSNRRVARLKRGSVTKAEYGRCSDALLGGQIMHYCQSVYFSFEQFESFEVVWRRSFSRSFLHGRPCVKGSVYTDLEHGGGIKPIRTHGWVFGLASLFVSMNKALSDVHDTPQRAACRSALALALSKWACPCDPNRWDFQHLRVALEDSLRLSACKFIGDAFMLACVLFEGAKLPLEPESSPQGIEELRARTFGRWELAGPLHIDDPLHPKAPQFRAPKSILLFEPPGGGGGGGLGAPPSPLLMEHGVISLGVMCVPPRWGASGEGEYVWTFADFALRVPRLPRSRRAQNEFEKLLDWLIARGVPPCRPERPRTLGAPGGAGVAAGLRWQEAGTQSGTGEAGAGSAVKPVAAEALAALAETAHAERSLPRSEQRAECEWRKDFRELLRPPSDVKHLEWDTGAPDWSARVVGPRFICDLGEEDGLRVFGGEARYGLRAGVDWEGLAEWPTGSDGFRAGWIEAAAGLRRLVSFDERGMPTSAVTGRVLSDVELGALPPCLQLTCRGRLALGEVEVLKESVGKRGGTHVSLDVQLLEFEQMCAWQARCDITAAYTSDAGTGCERDAEGRRRYDAAGQVIPVVSKACCRHDGKVLAGCIERIRGHDNYVGELGALLTAAEDVEAGGRVLLLFDATSPVRAWLRFRDKHNRHKLDYYANRLLDALERLLQKCELVIFIWQTSHVGSPCNEWADMEATAALALPVVPFPALRPSYFSMRYSRPPRSVFRWALERGRRVVFARLTDNLTQAVFPEPHDIRLGSLTRGAEVICESVRAGTCVLGDRLRRMSSPAAKLVRGAGCECQGRLPSGELLVPTWSHYMFWCPAPRFAVRRGALRACLQGVQIGDAFSGEGRGGSHSQLAALLLYLEGKGDIDFNRDDWDGAEAEREMRRLFGKCIAGTGVPAVDRSGGVRRALRALVCAGADLLKEAVPATAVRLGHAGWGDMLSSAEGGGIAGSGSSAKRRSSSRRSERRPSGSAQRHKVGTGGSGKAGIRGVGRHAVQCRRRRNRGLRIVGGAKELESKIGAASEWDGGGSSASCERIRDVGV